jgi:hypothetical protein
VIQAMFLNKIKVTALTVLVGLCVMGPGAAVLIGQTLPAQTTAAQPPRPEAILRALSQPPAGGSRDVDGGIVELVEPGQWKCSAHFTDSVQLPGAERPGTAAVVRALSRPPAGVSRDVDAILIEQVKPGLWKGRAFYTESVQLRYP